MNLANGISNKSTAMFPLRLVFETVQVIVIVPVVRKPGF